jgi:hypothetical protein
VQWWVAINWKLTLPTPETHPTFPLWKKDYTPEQVYDLFFPFDFRFICNIHRPSVCGRFGIPSRRLWRFEYIINEGEDPWKMAEPEIMKKIIYPYMTHKGKKYGLDEDVMFPEDCITVLRARPFKYFSFRARVMAGLKRKLRTSGLLDGRWWLVMRLITFLLLVDRELRVVFGIRFLWLGGYISLLRILKSITRSY